MKIRGLSKAKTYYSSNEVAYDENTDSKPKTLENKMASKIIQTLLFIHQLKKIVMKLN